MSPSWPARSLMYAIGDAPCEITPAGLTPAAAMPSAAQPVYSCPDDWPGAAPKPPSEFCARSRYESACPALEASACDGAAIDTATQSAAPAAAAGAAQRTVKRRRKRPIACTNDGPISRQNPTFPSAWARLNGNEVPDTASHPDSPSTPVTVVWNTSMIAP